MYKVVRWKTHNATSDLLAIWRVSKEGSVIRQMKLIVSKPLVINSQVNANRSMRQVLNSGKFRSMVVMLSKELVTQVIILCINVGK